MGAIIPQVVTSDRASGAQVIDGSLKFDTNNSNHLRRTPGSAGNRKTWTWINWMKKTADAGSPDDVLFTAGTGTNTQNRFIIKFSTGDQSLEIGQDVGGTFTLFRKTSQVFRDYTGWGQLVVAFDSTDSTADDRLKIYWNGSQITDFATNNTISENYETFVNFTNPHEICGDVGSYHGELDTFLSQVYLIDGQALGPENFGFTDPFTNTWRPKKYTGTFAIASGTPSVSNGGLVIKADGASINGTFVVNGGVKTWTSPDGVTWTRNGDGRSSAAAKYLAVGGAGTALRTFYPDAGSGGFTFYMYNGGGEFDGSSSPFTLDLSSQTYLPSQTSSFGGNGFYLPMDGNSLIGQDKSGNGNDWTPVNFGGSNTIEKATGAFPILNTVNGGNAATVGVRTDASVGVGTCVLALPLSNNATDVSNQIDGRSSQKSPSVTGAVFATSQSNFYGSSAYFNGPTDGNVTATNYITVPDSNGDFIIGTGDYTMEAWVWGTDWTPGTANEERGIMGHDGAPASEWNGFWSAAGKFGFYNAGSFVPSATPTDTRPTLSNEKWYHMAATRESGTVRCFLDGVLLGSQSSDTTNIATGTFSVGIKEPGAGNQFNGYIQDARLYVGVAKYTESFIPTSTNPDILPETPSGVSGSSKLTKSTDGTDINTVRGQGTSYCTLNPLTGNNTLSNGNLDSTGNQTAWRGNAGTIGVSSGKWYFESTVLSTNSGNVNADWGIVLESNSQWGGQTVGDYGISYYGSNGNKEKNNTNASTSSSGATTGDVVQVAFDLDKGKIWFGVNNTWIDSGNPSAGSNEAYTVESGTWFPAVAMYDNGTVSTNFGQKPFNYTPPDGFQPLNAANIRPETVITRPDQYVGVTTYTGNGAPGSANTQSFNIGFKPDLLWFKVRSTGSNNFLIDSVRTREKVLFSNNVNNESTCDVGKDLVSFDHNGFTVGEGNQTGANEDGEDIVAWSWKAGGNKNTFNVDDVGYATAAAAGITGLDGTNQMTTANYLGCSIGTKQGFSIINYRGLGGTNDVAIPHGLSQSPDLVMIKNRNSSVDWAVAHSGLVDNRELHLNTNEDSVSVAFLGLYKSNFTSTSFAVNYGESNNQYVNASNELYIAYVWHNVPGLQKFGSYNSNNSADGPYIELGFRPAIILIKCTSGAESWVIYDSERVPYNYNGLYLKADDGVAEPSSNTEGFSIDFLSNGFKIRGQWGAINDSNTTDHYIYAAWAEAPAVNLYGGQSNAR